MREEETRVSRSLTAQEQSPVDYEPMLEKLRSVLGDYVASHTDFTPFAASNVTARRQ